MTRSLPFRLSILLALLLGALPAGASSVIEEIVIKVNDSIVTKSEYEARIQSTREGMRREYKGPDLQQKLDEVPARLLEQMEEELLLVEKAKQMYQLDVLVDYQIENFMKENDIAAKEDLARALQAEGLTMEKFRKQILMVYVPEFMKSREIRSGISLTTDEIESYYERHQGNLKPDPQVRLQEILLSSDATTEQEARTIAAEVAEQIAAGRDFGELAARYSKAYSRSNHGEAGWFAPDELSEGFSRVIFSTPVGKITPLIHTEGGYYIFRIAERKEPEIPTLEDSREVIVRRLQEEKYQEAFEAYIERLKEENFVRINPKYV